jgi:hypothetical protein
MNANEFAARIKARLACWIELGTDSLEQPNRGDGFHEWEANCIEAYQLVEKMIEEELQATE